MSIEVNIEDFWEEIENFLSIFVDFDGTTLL